MKRYIYIAIGIVSMIIATSCQKDATNVVEEKGGFSLSLNVNDNETAVSRAPMTTSELENSAKVKIYKPNYQGLIREYTYSSMPGVVYLPTGNGYRVDVSAGEIVNSSPRKANFEQKSYKGSAEFNVVANQVIDNVGVVAKICNAITNATFDATIAENFEEGYTLTFALSKDETDPNKTLIYTADKSGKDGYFIIDEILLETKIYWTFQGALKSDVTPFKAQGVISASTDSDDADTIADLVGARQKMTFKYVVKDGTLKFEIEVDTQTEDCTDNIAWAPTSTGISPSKSYEIWATYATIHADVDTDTYKAEKVYFQYRKKTEGDTEQWSEFVSATRNDASGAYDALIKGLNSSTTYEYKLVVYTKDADAETIIDGIAEFTTGKDQQVPNASFENNYIYNEEYCVFNPADGYGFATYTPGDLPGKNHTWWGTGNQTAVGVTVDVSSTSTDIPHSENGNKVSACLQSTYKVIKFAAGNLYSGYFSGLHETTHGIVHFGRTTAADGTEFTSRPTGVSFYVRYKGNIVNRDGDGPLIKDKDYDKGQIKFAIGTWGKKQYGGSDESPLSVDTYNKNSFWDIASLDETIAYCDKIFVGDGTDTGWQKVTLKFDYNSNGKGNNPKTPTHIIISAASSMYGDYFEGAEGSTMYLDDIKLLYDHPDDIQAGVVAVQ